MNGESRQGMTIIGVIRDGQCRIDDYRIIRSIARTGVGLNVIISEELVISTDRNSIRSSLGDLDVILMRLQSGRTRYFLSKVAEASGYRVINTSAVQAYSRNKFLTYLIMSSSGVPSPIASFPLFSHQILGDEKIGVRRDLLRKLTELTIKDIGSAPCIEKPLDGSHGRKVRILRSEMDVREAISVRSTMDPMMFQPFYDSPFEIRAVSIKYPGSEPEFIASIAKCATEPEQEVRNLAVMGVPILIRKHKLIEKLEVAALKVLAPKSHDYLITGNDWTPKKVLERDAEKICAFSRKILSSFQRLKASREKLRNKYRKIYATHSWELEKQIEEAEEDHERLALEYIRSREHESIESIISGWLDDSPELLLLDINDNQDFPNVRDLTQRRLEEDYTKLALSVSTLKIS